MTCLVHSSAPLGVQHGPFCMAGGEASAASPAEVQDMRCGRTEEAASASGSGRAGDLGTEGGPAATRHSEFQGTQSGPTGGSCHPGPGGDGVLGLGLEPGGGGKKGRWRVGRTDRRGPGPPLSSMDGEWVAVGGGYAADSAPLGRGWAVSISGICVGRMSMGVRCVEEGRGPGAPGPPLAIPLCLGPWLLLWPAG